MPRLAAALAAALLGLSACGEDTIGRQLSHQENAAGLLETHKGDPEKAAAALREYIEANREDLALIHAEGHKLAADLKLKAKSPESEALLTDLLKPHAERLVQRKRAHEAFRAAHPKVASHPGVLAALRELNVGVESAPAAKPAQP